MRKIILKNCQKNAILNLYEKIKESWKLNTNQTNEFLLDAPTGAGKTLILSEIIKRMKNESSEILDKKIAILWFTPGTGQLHTQSKKALKKYFLNTNFDAEELRDFWNDYSIPEKTVYLVNWEKISKKNNKYRTDFKIKNKIKGYIKNKHVVVIVDEEHSNKNDLTKKIIEDDFDSKTIIRTSATPDKEDQASYDNYYHKEKIEWDVAVAEKLIRKSIKHYDGKGEGEIFDLIKNFQTLVDQNNSDYMKLKKLDSHESRKKIKSLIKKINIHLLVKAIEKRKKLKKMYELENSNVNPLIVVQFPTETKDVYKKIINLSCDFLENKINKGKLHWWLSDKKKVDENLSHNDHQGEIIITKNAIAQGWDCPRAQILVKLRSRSIERFNEQVKGRIRRIPEHEIGFYQNDELNHSYIYTWDNFFSDGYKNSINSQINSQNLIVKENNFDEDNHKNSVYFKDNPEEWKNWNGVYLENITEND